ncbi:MAG: hypothetical protein QXI81_06765, partial [Nitrososphaerota archaeon]
VKVLPLVIVILMTLVLPVKAQDYGGVSIQLLGKDDRPISFAVIRLEFDSGYYFFTNTDKWGKAYFWITQEQLNKRIKLEIPDVFNKPLKTNVSEVMFTGFNQIKVVKVLNSRIITINVLDEIGQAPPLAGITNAATERTISRNGTIIALISDDFEGDVKVGAPLRKDGLIKVTKDEDRYEITLKMAITFTLYSNGEEFVVSVRWDGIEDRDMGNKMLVPYSADLRLISTRGDIKMLGKLDPITFTSSSGEATMNITLPEEINTAIKTGEWMEWPDEWKKGALMLAFYIDYQPSSQEEIYVYFNNAWMLALTSFLPIPPTISKVYLYEATFSPFVDLLINQNAELERQLEDAKARIETLESQLASSMEELKYAREQVSSLTSQLEVVMEEVTILKGELSATRTQLQIASLTLILGIAIPSVIAALLALLYIRKKTKA